MQAADVVVVPSRWEGMPFVLLEAMATGRCVVATDIAPIREVLEGVGDLVPLDDRVALARSIVNRPKVLLLDEPSLGLAPLITWQIFDAIRTLNNLNERREQKKREAVERNQKAHVEAPGYGIMGGIIGRRTAPEN